MCLKMSARESFFLFFECVNTYLGLNGLPKEWNLWENAEYITYNIVKLREKKMNLIRNSRKKGAFWKISFFLNVKSMFLQPLNCIFLRVIYRFSLFWS